MTHEYTPNTYVFDELTIGQSYEFTRVIKDTDIKIFSLLSSLIWQKISLLVFL